MFVPRPNSSTPPGSRDDQRRSASAAVISAASEAESALELTSGHFRTFIHELSNLIEGSTRAVDRARRELLKDSTTPSGRASTELRSAAVALGHMSELIRSMSNPRLRARAPELLPPIDRPRPMHECIAHAVDVLTPLAEERAVTLVVRASDDLRSVPPMPLYSVISNGLKNAIEASAPGGTVELFADAPREAEGRVPVLRLDILDDGAGPDPRHARSYFRHGFTTKPAGSGIGLALSREIVSELGGSIELTHRRDAEGHAARGGALHIRIPLNSPTAGRAL